MDTTMELQVRTKAFDGQGVRTHRCKVEEDGTVRVWDSVAQHYTICHSLSRPAIRRIRQLAETELVNANH